MASNRNRDWGSWDEKSSLSLEEATFVVLLDIRGELRRLNSKADCFRIQRMFRTIERVDRRLAKKVRLK